MRAQQGSVLLVSLVLLLVMTVAGLAAIRMSSLEEKMSGNYLDQQMAFHAAEVALLEAETHLESTAINLSDFVADCTEGFCFSGSDISDVGSCAPGSTTPWQQDGIWSNSNLHRTTTIDLDGVATQAKYIIEFRCYIEKAADGPKADPTNPGDWAWYFRITALASGGSDNARVMLQSSYKKTG